MQMPVTRLALHVAHNRCLVGDAAGTLFVVAGEFLRTLPEGAVLEARHVQGRRLIRPVRPPLGALIAAQRLHDPVPLATLSYYEMPLRLMGEPGLEALAAFDEGRWYVRRLAADLARRLIESLEPITTARTGSEACRTT